MRNSVDNNCFGGLRVKFNKYLVEGEVEHPEKYEGDGVTQGLQDDTQEGEHHARHTQQVGALRNTQPQAGHQLQ